MRISDTRVVQLIEATPPFLVLVDEETGREVQIHDSPGQLLGFVGLALSFGTPVEIDGMVLTPTEVPFFCAAVGYFISALHG